MHKQKLTALLLAAALTAGLCAGTVLAGGDEPDPVPGASEGLLIVPAPTPEEGTTAEGTTSDPAGDVGAAVELPDLVGTPRASIITTQTSSQDDKAEDPAGTVSFHNLEARLRKHNLNIHALDASMEAIHAIDYEEMEEGLELMITMQKGYLYKTQQLLNGTKQALAGITSALDDEALKASVAGLESALIAYPQATVESLESQIASYQATLQDVRNGVMRSDSDAVLEQLANTKNQVILGAQTLYITMLGLDQTAQSLERQLSSLDRTLEELDLRYKMGQISSLTLAEAKAGRTSLVSGMQTLDMNRTALKRQLESMLGEKITGTIQLQPLTAVTAEQLSAMDLEADLKKATKQSYALYAANKAVSDADDDLDAVEDKPMAANYEIDSAEYALDAAICALEAEEQSFELGFRSLYDTVHDQSQVLNAARTALAVKEAQLAAAKLKYEQGTISRNALLSAQDARDDAQDTVDTAAVDLFTSYNNYCWAVDYGILN